MRYCSYCTNMINAFTVYTNLELCSPPLTMAVYKNDNSLSQAVTVDV